MGCAGGVRAWSLGRCRMLDLSSSVTGPATSGLLSPAVRALPTSSCAGVCRASFVVCRRCRRSPSARVPAWCRCVVRCASWRACAAESCICAAGGHISCASHSPPAHPATCMEQCAMTLFGMAPWPQVRARGVRGCLQTSHCFAVPQHTPAVCWRMDKPCAASVPMLTGGRSAVCALLARHHE